MFFNRFLKKNKEKRGFTLIELMAVILVLALIIILAVVSINTAIDKANKGIDEASKNVILAAAESYALEYRGSDDWNEVVAVNDSKQSVSFCISLKSLINYGYFKNDESNFEDYKNKYAVKIDIVDGVKTSKFIDLDGSSECKSEVLNSNIDDPNDGKIDIITNSGSNVGDFDYEIGQVDAKKYDIRLDLNIKNDVIATGIASKPINVLFIMDTSASMVTNENGGDSKFDKARDAIINFSSELQGIIPDSKTALISFNWYASLLRDFRTTPFSKKLFYSGSGTNMVEGIDLATSLLYNKLLNNEFDKNDLENTYVIMLSDGDPSVYSYLTYEPRRGGKVYMTSSSLRKKYRNYNITGNEFAEVYFKNLLLYGDKLKHYDDDVVVVDEELSDGNWLTYFGGLDPWNEEECSLYEEDSDEQEECYMDEYQAFIVPSLRDSSNYLKNLGVKFFLIGYEMIPEYDEYYLDVKRLTTQNNDLCITNTCKADDESCKRYRPYSEDGKNYCYYDGTSKEIINNLFKNLLNNIVEYNSSFEQINLVLEPVYGQDGNALINLYKDDVLVNNNKVIMPVPATEFVDDVLSVFKTDLYSFKINDSLFDELKNNCQDNNCTKSELELFNIYIEIVYPDGSTDKMLIDSPKFDLSIDLDERMN